eukprot:196284-Pleurochrysis_carterae.AAC.1
MHLPGGRLNHMQASHIQEYTGACHVYVQCGDHTHTRSLAASGLPDTGLRPSLREWGRRQSLTGLRPTLTRVSCLAVDILTHAACRQHPFGRARRLCSLASHAHPPLLRGGWVGDAQPQCRMQGSRSCACAGKKGGGARAAVLPSKITLASVARKPSDACGIACWLVPARWATNGNQIIGLSTAA